MEGALLIVVVVVTLACSLIAIFTLAGSGKTYRQIGSGGLSTPDPEDAGPDERDEEIRQMFEARNARRERRGEAPLDIDAELAALSGQTVDEGLRDEVRQLVLARNRRRERKGQPPLDVEAEVDRQLRELT
ncbi:MAG: hypothetical protein ACRDKY_02960 [Solirubrobacteraceae bacterium]